MHARTAIRRIGIHRSPTTACQKGYQQCSYRKNDDRVVRPMMSESRNREKHRKRGGQKLASTHTLSHDTREVQHCKARKYRPFPRLGHWPSARSDATNDIVDFSPSVHQEHFSNFHSDDGLCGSSLRLGFWEYSHGLGKGMGEKGGRYELATSRRPDFLRFAATSVTHRPMRCGRATSRGEVRKGSERPRDNSGHNVSE